MHRRPSDNDNTGVRGAARFVSRVLENPENPLAWSLPIARFGGMVVRVHVFTILFLGSMLVWPINLQSSGILWMAPAALALLLIVMLHELGHAAACRAVGGRPDRVVLLPFGGLMQPSTPDRWTAHLTTALGGPLVHILLFPALLGALHLIGLSAHAAFDMLAPERTLAAPEFAASSTVLVVGKALVWWLYAMNIYVFTCNVLALMLPFDAGRALHALAWSKLGYEKAMAAALVVGLAGAMVLSVVALVLDQTLLILVAAIGAYGCATEKRRLTAAAGGAVSPFSEREGVADGDPLVPLPRGGAGGDIPDDLEDELRATEAELSGGAGEVQGAAEPGEAKGKPAEPQAEKSGGRDGGRIALLTDQEHRAAVDRVLSKISASGMASLTDEERALLDQATRRTRGE